MSDTSKPSNLAPRKLSDYEINKLRKDIDNIFKDTIGQNAAKERIKHWALGAAASDGYMKPLFIGGEPGLGKTHIINAIVKILPVATPEKKGNIIMVEKGSELGTFTSFMDEIVIKYISDRDGAIIVDEMHEAHPKTQNSIRAMIQPDVERKAVTFSHNDYPICVDPKKFTWVFASNEVDKFKRAFQSRVLSIDLQPYTAEEIAEMLVNMVEKNGLKFNEDSIMPLARTSRGTARDMVDMVNDLVKTIAIRGKTTISKEDVRDLLKVRDMLPEGLKRNELRTLLFLESDGPLQLQQIACRNGLTSAEQKVHESYLFRQGFLTVDSRRELTAAGRAYLDDLRKHHFIPARKTSNDLKIVA